MALACSDRRKLVREFLFDGGRISDLFEDDYECIIELGPEFTWALLLDTLCTHNTKGSIGIKGWDLLHWEVLEEAIRPARADQPGPVPGTARRVPHHHRAPVRPPRRRHARLGLG